MYRNFHPRRKEKIVTTILWFLALACSTYILWKINPYPIQRGIGWTKQKTEQFLIRCIDNTVSNTLPSLCFFQVIPFISSSKIILVALQTKNRYNTER